MTPEKLHTTLGRRARERGLTREQLATELEVDVSLLDAMRGGVISGQTREKAQAWLEET